MGKPPIFKRFRRFEPFFFAAFAALVAALGAAARPEIYPRVVEIALAPAGADAWRADYRLSAPARVLDLGPSLNGFRARDWRVETPGLKLAQAGGRDRIEPAHAGARFSEARILVTPRRNGFSKNYESMRRLAGGGEVLYTGHFWPYTEDGGRYPAAFDIEARPGERVEAFGKEADAFRQWRSPTGLPSFVYAGPLEETRARGLNAILDPAAPDWTKRETLRLAPRLIDYYQRVFDRRLARAPDFFLTLSGEAEPGYFRYDGDALPGQFEIALSGGGWREESAEGRALLQKAAAHEIAHLFEAVATPLSETAPNWIHEGGADALGTEALTRLGVISRQEARARLDKARETCARVLDYGSLDQAEAKGNWAASYACGRVLTVIAARASSPSGSAAAFWRDFIARAEIEGGYDEALFFDMIAERAGPAFALQAKAFPHMVYASPSAELARLLAAARPRAPSPAAAPAPALASAP